MGRRGERSDHLAKLKAQHGSDGDTTRARHHVLGSENDPGWGTQKALWCVVFIGNVTLFWLEDAFFMCSIMVAEFDRA